jgi:hypothetical protein
MMEDGGHDASKNAHDSAPDQSHKFARWTLAGVPCVIVLTALEAAPAELMSDQLSNDWVQRTPEGAIDRLGIVTLSPADALG